MTDKSLTEGVRHTPGPWEAKLPQEPFPNRICIYADAHSPKLMAEVLRGTNWASLGSDKAYHDEPDARANEAMANARLMASAPELLGALQRSEQYLILAVADNSGDLRKIAERDLAMVRAAISKATGAAP